MKKENEKTTEVTDETDGGSQSEAIEIEPEVVASESSDDQSDNPEVTGEDASEPGEETEESLVDKLKRDMANMQDILTRERADFINYRRRTVQEKEQLTENVIGKLLNDILPVMDAFDQLFQAAEKQGEQSMERFLDGATLIRKQLWQVFSEKGMEEIDPAEKEEFDPVLMEALSVEEIEGVEAEGVKAVYQKGYRYKDKVIRPARVAVVKPPQSGANEN